MKYDFIIFDLDGTILDTLEDLADSSNYALKENGFPSRTIDEVRSFVGNGIPNLMKRIVPEGTSDSQIKAVHKSFTEHYKVHCADKTKAYTGVNELISKLRSAGCRTAVVSNKADYAVKELCKQYFDGMFDAVMGEQQPLYRKKPYPDLVNCVIEAVGAEKSRTLYIGDSDVDIETARNSEIHCISVCWGFRSREFLEAHGAEIIIDSTEALAKLILD